MAEDMVTRLAQAKARAIAVAPGEVVLGADTAVLDQGETVSKPVDAADARRMWGLLAGQALAVSINSHLATLPFQPELIVASFHGMPQKYVDAGDPYREQCEATTEALRRRLGLDASKLLLTFQSRFGNDEWLQPYTDKTIEALANKGTKRIAVVTPGFSADCLETLEEIAQENAEIFLHNGGEEFSAIPCLNDSDAGMDVIRQLVLRELQGWI